MKEAYINIYTPNMQCNERAQEQLFALGFFWSDGDKLESIRSNFLSVRPEGERIWRWEETLKKARREVAEVDAEVLIESFDNLEESMKSANEKLNEKYLIYKLTQ